MPYNPTFSFRNAAASEWISASDFSRVVTAMQGVNPRVQAGRDSLVAMMNDLVFATPFSVNVRFPADDTYFNLASSDWGRKLTQLRTSASWTDPANAPTTGNAAQQAAAAGNTRGGLNDALLGIVNALSDMRMQILRGDGASDRAIFEARFPWVANRPSVLYTPNGGYRIGSTLERATSSAWPTLANTVALSAANFDIPFGSVVYVWSDQRCAVVANTGGCRARMLVTFVNDTIRQAPEAVITAD